MRIIIALAVMVTSCGSTQTVGVTVPRPIHNSKCSDSELRSGHLPGLASKSGPGWAVSLHLCAFREGFRLCNPSGEPVGMTGFWEVSPDEVAAIDRDLLAFLLRQDSSRTDLEQYGRQHLGFFRGTRRYVFINAIPPSVRVSPERAEAEVIAVCDDNWGVEYDVGTRQFANFGIDSGPRHQ